MNDNSLNQLRDKNPTITIYEVDSLWFQQYGRVLPLNKALDAIFYLQNTTIPTSGNQYVAHDDKFVKALQNTSLFDDIFGYVPLQYGYVNGHNTKMNALEYHKSSEINIALDDIVLFVGHAKQIVEGQLNTSNTTAIFVPKNTIFELYPKVLHFSPCATTSKGFRCGVILPRGTNLDLVVAPMEKSLFKTNKWLLAHEEAATLIDQGAQIGLQGANLEIQTIEEIV